MTLSWLPTYIMRLLYLPNKVNTGPDLTYKKSAFFFANSFGAFCWKVHPIVLAIKNNLRKIFKCPSQAIISSGRFVDNLSFIRKGR